jgi:carboxymethylenebutenolidase
MTTRGGASDMDVQTQMVEIPSGAGTMPAFLARPRSAGRLPAVIVVMEAFGLNDHIKDVAKRIAAEGYVTLAPDLYWRGGKGRTAKYDDLPNAIGMMQSLKDGDIVTDVRSAVAYLEKDSSVRADRIGITGFCMGGRVSFLAAAELPDKIKAAAPFYGGGIPIDKTEKTKAPMLIFFGEDDGFIPLDQVDALRAELAKHKKPAEVVVYKGAGHGFFCNERDSYQQQAASDAWERLGKFFGQHLKS